ncbi:MULTISPECIES: hypothetical protein [Sandaracinus]|uniref:hypothetical protein n=1 Tax=Sandaracinus TaxID=1055688 RepID=UPI0019D4D80F|nr:MULTISPECIES: hypothetical protein [Sandaracinus]QRN75813.1 Hypothetical protein MSR10575_89000 [Sandaracinus sp.]UJR87339.1 Hypothetical protein I5071_1310 [Sandaracinus amylolyticus]
MASRFSIFSHAQERRSAIGTRACDPVPFHTACAEGLVCDARARRCARRLVLGEPCSGFYDCEPGASCVAGACVELGEEGALCTEDLCGLLFTECNATRGAPSCAAGLVCMIGEHSDGRRCQRPRPDGAACIRQPLELGIDDCADGLVCAAEDGAGRGRCVAPAAIGERCDPSIGCAPGARCVVDTCIAIVRASSACERDSACVAGSRCVDGRCVESRVIGDACDASTPYALGACIDGRCALIPFGQECDPLAWGVNDCASGVCRSEEIGESERCLAPQRRGGLCPHDHECAAPFVCRASQCVVE